MTDVYYEKIIQACTCGDNLIWVFDDKGVLTIEGKGKMTDSPWNYSFDDYTDYSESISEIALPDGFTSINSAFFK